MSWGAWRSGPAPWPRRSPSCACGWTTRGPTRRSRGATLTSADPHVGAVVLAYGAEPLLRDCVEAILSSRGVHVDVVVVDNGCTTDGVESVSGLPGVTVLRPGRNTGF